MVKEVHANYAKSAVFGDLLDVNSKLTIKKAASIIMEQKIYRDEELLFEATFKLAYLKNYKLCKIPKELFDVFE